VERIRQRPSAGSCKIQTPVAARPRWRCCYCLGAARLPESIPILKEALSDSYEGVRIKAKKALIALAQLGHPAAKEAVAQATAVKEQEAPEDFMKLSELSASLSRSDVAQDLRAAEVKARRKATGQLTAMGVVDAQHLPVLLSQLDQETDPIALAHLVSAVALAGGEQTVPSMKKFTTHADSRVRAALADAMAKIATPAALAVVRPLLLDTDAKVVAQALLALAQDPTVDLDRGVESLASHRDPMNRRMAIFVITELELERLAHFLEKLAQDPDAAVAGMARQAQGIVRPAQRAAPAPTPAAPAIPAPARPTAAAGGEVNDDSIASFTALWGPGPPPPQAQAQPQGRPSRAGPVLRPSMGIPRTQVDAMRRPPQFDRKKIGGAVAVVLVLVIGLYSAFSGTETPVETRSAESSTSGRFSVSRRVGAAGPHPETEASPHLAASVGARLDVEGKVLSIIPTGCLLRAGGRILLLQGGESQHLRIGSQFKGWGTVTQIEPGGMVHLSLNR
jgi:HEAT repeat protein